MMSRALFRVLSLFLAIVLALPYGAAAQALRQIGVAGAVSGRVQAFPPIPKPVGRIVESGKPLFANERISTGPGARLQVMLADETVFTLGPNSTMTLDEFVYDPETKAGNVTARVTKGVFRFVTGLIGHKDPSRMKVKFPIGTMGIRGTIVAGKVEDNGQTTAVLLGPGADNNAGERVGAFALENAGATVEVTQPGFGSTITGADVPPTPPALIPPAELGAMLGALSGPQGRGDDGERGPRPDGGEAEEGNGPPEPGERRGGPDRSGAPEGEGPEGEQAGPRPGPMPGSGPMPGPMPGMEFMGPGPSVTDLSGEGVVGALGDLMHTEGFVQLGEFSGETTTNASFDSGEHLLGEFIDFSGSTWGEIGQFFRGGLGRYQGVGPFFLVECNGGPCSAPSGTLTYLLEIDFDNGTYGGGDSAASFSAQDAGTGVSVSDSLTIPSQSFLSLSGPAVIQELASSEKFGVSFTLNNVFGVPGGEAEVEAFYSDGSNAGLGLGFSPLEFFLRSEDITWATVQGLTTGKGYYQNNGPFMLSQCGGSGCVNPYGAFSFRLEIDFANKTYGGGSSGATLTAGADNQTAVSESITLAQQSYASLSGLAKVAAASSSGKLTVDYTLQSVNGVAAIGAEVDAAYSNGGTSGSGQYGGFFQADGTSSGGGGGTTIPDGSATWDHVRSITSGSGSFPGASGGFTMSMCNSSVCSGSAGGSWGYSMTVDFAAKTISGSASISASDPISEAFISNTAAISQDYSAITGGAAFSVASGGATYSFNFQNQGGVAAKQVMGSATYSAGGNAGTGATVTSTRP